VDKNSNYNPPRLALTFFRWFCHPDFREEIEGDLLEQFHKKTQKYGLLKAKSLFIKDVLLLFRSNIIKNFSHFSFIQFTDMKTIISLFAFCLLTIVLIVSPFFPGPSNSLVIGLSSVSLTLGFLGLLLVPVGVLWVIAEWKKSRQPEGKTINWKPSYYLSIIATVIIVTISLIYIPLTYHFAGVLASAAFVILLSWLLYRMIRFIRKIKSQSSRAFISMPVYLIALPLIAFTANKFLVDPLSNYSRKLAIKKSEILIHAIEAYKNREGEYPESLENLKGKYIDQIPKSSVMGVTSYRYSKLDDDFTLAFSQWKDGASLEELVIYDKSPVSKKDYANFNYKLDRYRTLGAFASYDAGIKHWRYYLCD